MRFCNIFGSAAPLRNTAAFLSAILLLAAGNARAADSDLAFTRAGIFITAERLQNYSRGVTGEPKQQVWCWLPRLEFYIFSAPPPGSQFTAAFTLPDGSPWFSENLVVNGSSEAKSAQVISHGAPGHDDKRAILSTGVFGVKIAYKNELTGGNQPVFSGKFRVAKVFRGANALPQFKNQYEYYVVHDWVLPIGYLWLNPANDEKVPSIAASMWFQGPMDTTRVAGYLFHDGKQVASTKESNSASETKALNTSGNDENPRWSFWNFSWPAVKAYNQDKESANNHDQDFFLDKNPGDYEIKILRDGELVRSTKFTVGADGKIVDNGIGTQNNIPGRYILPLKITGASDGKWDANAWKTEAFYGNPLKGFTIP